MKKCFHAYNHKATKSLKEPAQEIISQVRTKHTQLFLNYSHERFLISSQAEECSSFLV